MAPDKQISGVGGWLSFLIASLMVLGPLLGSGRLNQEFSVAIETYPHLANDVNWANYKQISWSIFWLSSAFAFAAGYRLWKLHFPESVRFAVIALWVSGPVSGIAYVVVGMAIYGAPSSSGLGELVAPLVGSVLGAAVWTAYLKRSVRVRNTYNLGLPANEQQP